MPDDFQSIEILRGLRALGPQLSVRLGNQWPRFAPQFLALLKQIDTPATSEDERRRLIDQLIVLTIGTPAADLMRSLLSRSFGLEVERTIDVNPTDRATVAERAGQEPELQPRPALRPAPPARTTSPPSAPRLARVGRDLARDLEARYLNVRLAEAEGGRTVPGSEWLKKSTAYFVRLDIGGLSDESVVRHSSTTPFPPLELGPGEEGHWLDVVGSSRDFTVPPGAFRLFLPHQGPSWVCDCDPGEAHHCHPADRRAYLDIPVTTPPSAQRADLRLAVYDGPRLLQSLLLTARVEIYTKGPGYQATIDYNLTARFADLSESTETPLASVLTNDNTDATHTIIIKGRGKEPLHLTLTEAQMGGAIDAARTQLRATHFLEFGGTGGTRRQRKNLLDSTNGKSMSDFIADLKALAPLGWKLLDALLAGQKTWWRTTGQTLFRQPGTLLVGRKKASKFVFPWALVYDIPLDTGKPESLQPCPVLKNWPPSSGQPFPARCPEEARHGLGTICPFGFWGIRHQIEQPPSQQEGRSAPAEVTADRRPLEAVFARALSLDAKLSQDHLNRLASVLMKFHLRDATSSAEVQTELGLPALELLYFYCHGRSTPLAPGVAPQPEIEVGKADRITPDGIFAWSLQDTWPVDHWRDIPPLVFINGCHTAEITPATLVSFVDAFADLEAAGVIGTEITVDQLLANEAGEQFLTRFTAGATVADAIRELRGHFLRKGNCLGLAYTPYCRAALHLVTES